MSKVQDWYHAHRPLVLWIAGIAGIALCAAIFFAAGMSYQATSATSNEQSDVFSREVGSYKYISPLLDCGYPSDKTPIELRAVMDRRIAAELESGNISHASVYFRDLNNGPWVGINSRELFSPASLMKVPVMIAYLRWAMVEPEILDKEIVATKSVETISQNIAPETKLEPGEAYRVDYLLNLLITESNNAALTLLSELIPLGYLDETYKRLGISLEGLSGNPTGNTTTVVEYATFFRVLYNASFLSNDMSEKALTMLTQTKFNAGLRAGVPGSIPVAHKFGERRFTETNELQLHDCGIVYAPEKPYLLCIMTRGTEFEAMANTIRDISADVYEEFAQ